MRQTNRQIYVAPVHDRPLIGKAKWFFRAAADHDRLSQVTVAGGKVRCDMSFIIAAPQELAVVASNVADMGASIHSATTAASAHTNSLAAAAADEISTQIAAAFSAHGQEFQQVSAQAAAFHDQFVQTLTASGNAYTAAEANAAQALAGSSVPLSAAAMNNASAAAAYLPYFPYTGIGIIDRLIYAINTLFFQFDLLLYQFIF